MVRSEEDRCKRFEEGLSPDIQRHLAVVMIRVYTDLVDRASAVERRLRESDGVREIRPRPSGFQRPFERHDSRRQRTLGSFRPQFSGARPVGSVESVGPPAPVREVWCQQCHQSGHRSWECPRTAGQVARPASSHTGSVGGPGGGERACYGCGRPGHVVARCPDRIGESSVQRPHQSHAGQTPQFRQRQMQPPRHPRPAASAPAPRPPQQQRPAQQMILPPPPPRFGPRAPQGRSYAIADRGAEGPRQGRETIQGTCLLFRTWASFLFDTGASHSFISSSFAKSFDLKIIPLSRPLSLDTPVTGNVVLTSVCRECDIRVADHLFYW